MPKTWPRKPGCTSRGICPGSAATPTVSAAGPPPSPGTAAWTTSAATGAARQPASTPIEDLGNLAAGDDTAQSAVDTVATQAAVAMIADLPPDQAEAVMLRVVMGLDAETAGRVLGKKAGAVRTAAYRGLRRLATRLEQAGSDDQ